MRFNCHCHVFNFQNVFCEGTLEILENRVMEKGFRRSTAKAIVNILRKFIQNGGGFERDSDGPDKHDFDDPHPGLDDLLAFLRLAMLKEMDWVCDEMMEQLPQDVAIVPLMMDILTEENKDDGGIFAKQLAGTQRQMLRYPGRLFPFYAFNPWRERAYDLAVDNLKDGGFAGIKLYPSLGYKIDNEEVERIARYCAESQTPMLMHCNLKGFRKDAYSAQEANPYYWRQYLNDMPGLKICFGHFGGQENILKGDYTDSLGDFTATILKFMRNYPGQVFADVSFHSASLNGSDQAKYFKHLKTLLDIPAYRTQILWGSDTFLLRSCCTESEFTQVFESHLSSADFAVMRRDNPAAFLGFNEQAPMQSGKNIISCVNYLKNSFTKGTFKKQQAAYWLQTLLP